MNRNQEANLEIDGRLRDYFQAEMPEPWPSPPIRAVVSAATSPVPIRRFGRLALVASIALVLAGYLMLASFFPARSPSGLNPGQHPHIGQRPKIPVKVEPK